MTFTLGLFLSGPKALLLGLCVAMIDLDLYYAVLLYLAEVQRGRFLVSN